jgi:hypothetical protein
MVFYLALSETLAMTRSSNSLARQNWQARIDAQASSGLSIAQFCEQHDCSVASFYQWKRKLAASNASDASDKPQHGAIHPSPFQQLRTKPVLPGPAWIELSLPSGAIVRVPADQLDALELILRLTTMHA